MSAKGKRRPEVARESEVRIPLDTASMGEVLTMFQMAVQNVGVTQALAANDENLATLQAFRKATFTLEDVTKAVAHVIPRALAQERREIARRMKSCAVAVGEVN